VHVAASDPPPAHRVVDSARAGDSYRNGMQSADRSQLERWMK
jgi:hypothetical protein